MGGKGDLKPRLMKALHAEAVKRGLDHDELSGLCRAKFNVRSMREMTAGQMQALLREWTGRALPSKRTTPLPQRGYGRTGALELVSGEDLETLGRAFAARGWGIDTQAEFVRRQLRGRDQIRTRKDFNAVFRAVQAMNRRDGTYDDRRGRAQGEC